MPMDRNEQHVSIGSLFPGVAVCIEIGGLFPGHFLVRGGKGEVISESEQ